jgi:hypothetical protein
MTGLKGLWKEAPDQANDGIGAQWLGDPLLSSRYMRQIFKLLRGFVDIRIIGYPGSSLAP